MKLVRCRNGFKDKKNGMCGHIVGTLTERQIKSLKDDPEGGPVYRCPACPKDQRWMRVIDEGIGPVFEVIKKPEEGKLPSDLRYVEERTYNQIG